MRRLRAEVEPLEALPFRRSVRNKAKQKNSKECGNGVRENFAMRGYILDSVKRLTQEKKGHYETELQ